MFKPATTAHCQNLAYNEIYQLFNDFGVITDWATPLGTWLRDIDETANPNFVFTYLKNSSKLFDTTDCAGQDCFQAVRCTINSFWTPVNIWYNTAQASFLYFSNPQPAAFFSSRERTSFRPVVMKRDWLEQMTIPVLANITEYVQNNLNSWGVPQTAGPLQNFTSSSFQTFVQPTNYSQAISILMAGVVTEALGQSSSAAGESIYTGNCSDTKPGFVFDPKICAKKPIDWIISTNIGELQSKNSMVTFSIRRSGWGWFIDSLTVKISLGILVAHSLLTLIYLAIILIFRRSLTTCWSSAPEMLMLAIDSFRSPVLMGSSAKAAHKDLWREPVRIMEVDGGERVSLVVGDPQSYPDRLGGSPVLGKKYL
jgi:hypothetical protein